ncbi:MAG: putative CoA-substrate-specific enzyme activase [Dehalococcoidia bacterium]|nr:putative CoA-substrate-specific enzyme activase [Dehalococcoidia bacterium]
MYDYAPMLIGFLNALDARIVLTSKTTQQIIEHAVEMGHADSCFPIKLLHGHVAALKEVDYILYPSAIRLGKKDGDENQKYACPLVQASPFIVRQALNLGERLLIPTIDFSQGDTDVVKSLAGVAVKMGFSGRRGRRAAMAGIEAQRRFEAEREVLGSKLLKQIHENGQLGVVLISRSYVSQDSGANLGIAEKLAQLGVVPVPLDYLPLDSVDPKKYSDSPYWAYESKFIAGTAITTSDPQLYGLVLTNFGCGPNSFILRILEDITGTKPLGQLEIDEHAAEAGIVTRLEAFVDTIQGYAASAKKEAQRPFIYRGTSAFTSSRKTVLLPRMAPFVEAVGAAMVSYGVDAVVLPEPDERNLLYSNQVTTGTECLPYRVTLGDFIRVHHENGHNLKEAEGLMAGSYGPCRFGKYVTEEMRVLKGMGFDLPIRSTVSNKAYSDLGLGKDFERLVWKGVVAIDNLEKLLWRTRPYEKEKGRADRLFDEYVRKIAGHLRSREDLARTLRQATSDFSSLIAPDMPRRPRVGINGEIYLRSNTFSNNNLVKECEAAGLEVIVSSIGEWIKYISVRNVEDSVKSRNIQAMAKSQIRKLVQSYDEQSVARHFREMLPERETSIAEILARSNQYLSTQCGSEAVLSIGTGVEWLESSEFAGVISVMPHGCMPGGIVAAMAEKFGAMHQKPWISLTYDGFLETNNRTKISEFAELIKFCRGEAGVGSR